MDDKDILLEVIRRFCEDDFWNCVMLSSGDLILDGRVELQDHEAEALKRLGLFHGEE